MIIIKQSKFNIYYTADDGTQLAFNSLTCGLAVVDGRYHRLMENLDGLSDENVADDLRETYFAAKEGSFIIDDGFDELLDLSTKRNFQKYGTESLGLTIAPTLACNLECIYCYEYRKSGIMDETVADKIVSLVESQAPHLKNLSISWYGGEPLLGTKVIYGLSEKFMEICRKNDIEYSAFIISNGTLLTDEMIGQLIKYNIHGIQITIDGPPDIHDNRRINRSGESTFDTIIRNINKIIKTGKIEVVIRINVDRSNENGIDSLIKILSECLASKNIRITFGQVTAYTEACRSIEGLCFENSEFAVNLPKYYGIIKKYGFGRDNEFPYPEPKLNYCCAELLNSFVIDHEGYLYKCWNQVGDTDNSIGNITGSGFDITGYKNGRWMDRNPVFYEGCSDCRILPVCMGGCPYNSMVLKRGRECDLVKYNLKDIMLEYYKESKNREDAL